MKMWLVAGLLLLLRAEGAEALAEPELCYVLDAVLFIYGIVLTVLYCRLKLQVRKASKAVHSTAYSKEEGIYTGLSTQNQETYETLRTKPN
ncbi:high affinity immunoglobulin epsilon receptor subunit gamma isoform X2 [Dermochelys coriacea]|uniref:high affinity immunoglobulin epsilon receptor subunit gamma isoform X2 n=1 Tax=Dermochelys coriacea TaxID=27794 RepID=UPI0018E6F5FB|nr:high affinity immunoglobulin epsilon receptor subunit gamma isoform X2 [Dermochelys coriacea]